MVNTHVTSTETQFSVEYKKKEQFFILYNRFIQKVFFRKKTYFEKRTEMYEIINNDLFVVGAEFPLYSDLS